MKRKSLLMRLRGFTLLELLIAVVIIAILAALGIPVYGKIIEKSRVREAVVVLHAIRTAQEEYRLENGTYLVWSPDAEDINDKLNLDIEPKNWSYIVWSFGGLWARAYRISPGPSIYVGLDIYLLQDGTWAGNHPFRPQN